MYFVFFQKLKENDRKRSTAVAPRNQDFIIRDDAVFSADDPDKLAKEEMDLRKTLREAAAKLKASETELSQLRTKVDTQSSELIMERMRASNYAEEKEMLYDQVNKMKSLLLDVYGAPDRQRTSTIGRQHSKTKGAKQESLISGWSAVDPSQTPERIFRVILVGDSAVGKTSFMHRFCTGDFYQNTRSTIGVDFKARNLFIDGILCTIELWDTAGQERQVLFLYEITK
ncbi:unnamed protein product [Dibothriocephalus latus]|uniref:Uncharacterized protein n=1 Tax=Dibothriocephalus latus TaxID=60516 RepID=A0A3P6VDF1_DIBLA|nr:unnamed protein product [Dibothriocephalus latus]